MDNTSVIDCIGATAPDSSQAQFRAFQKVGDKNPYQISVKWCPGHSNIFGNELADLLAKQGASLPTTEHIPSVSYRRRQGKGQIAVDYQQWWQGVEEQVTRRSAWPPSYGNCLNSLSHAVCWGICSLPDHTTVTLRTTTRGSTQARRPWSAPAGAKSRLPISSTAGKSLAHLRARLAPDPEAAIGRFLGRSYKVYVRIADFCYTKINRR